MPLQEVRRQDGHVVYKVTTHKGVLLCYRIFALHEVGDASKAKERPTLDEADIYVRVASGRV